MAMSNNTQDKIKSFVREQAQSYIEEAEMTYIEKLRHKAGQTKSKINNKLARFKTSSEYSKEVQDDMYLYMNDYINDLISQGLSEEEAFLKAKENLTMHSNEQVIHWQNKFEEYYASKDPVESEAIGLFYGGFVILGLSVGGLTGFLSSGALANFMQEGWIYTLVGTGMGCILGVGLGLISNAIIVKKNNK